MTQVFEPVKFGEVSEADYAALKCDHSLPKTKWRLKLEGRTDSLADHARNGRGDDGLVTNIVEDRGIKEPIWPPAGQVPSLAAIKKGNPGTWPHQAHHLIPWQTLDKHDVRRFLDPGWKGSKLASEANYSVNHGRNGKFMPYVSSLPEWQRTSNADRKQAIAEEVMDKLGIQLHQGPHKTEAYGAGARGYKKMVTELLNGIRLTENLHQQTCKVCEAAKTGDKFPPRKEVSVKLDWASGRLERAIDSNETFVSLLAYFWWDVS